LHRKWNETRSIAINENAQCKNGFFPFNLLEVKRLQKNPEHKETRLEKAKQTNQCLSKEIVATPQIVMCVKRRVKPIVSKINRTKRLQHQKMWTDLQ
jgi:hypothetical protein